MSERTLVDTLRVYFVADPEHCPGDLVEIVQAAIAGGVTAVQLRAKAPSDREVFALANRLREITFASGVMFLLNDRLDLAKASVADGVHLGVDDLPVAVARFLGGPDFVIGFSPETDEQTASARDLGASYLGVGPVFGTSTKADAGEAIGLEAITRRGTLSGIPVIGIGGVHSANAASVIEAGAVGVAVVSAISKAKNPQAAAAAIAKSVRTAL